MKYGDGAAIKKLTAERDDAEERLLRIRRLALDAIATRHLVYRGWSYRLFTRIVNIIENKEDTP